MDLLMIILVTVIPVLSDGLTVHGPSGPVVAPLGSSVVLLCSVDESLPIKDLEVEWKRSDTETLVHLYQDGESRAEAQQQDYQDRAHFFTDQIQHGNFSLRLDDLRSEDEGQYTCTVHGQRESGETMAEIKVDVERLRVSGSSRSVSVSVGEDVTLNCFVDSNITLQDIEEVSWRKTDEDIMVLLYQEHTALPEASNEQYRDRVEFFSDEISKLNFSLRLKSVRTEDKGVYMCEVLAGGLSGDTTVELERLGFSALHILVLILCVSASGSALLLVCLIYCRSSTKGLIVQNTLNRVSLAGGSVVLPCHVPLSLLTEDLKVEWRRNKLKDLVHLYQNGDSQTEKQHQDYKERAQFFTEHLKHGNFSLRLDKLRSGDEGEYTCTVYSQQKPVFSAKTKLVLNLFTNGKVISQGGSVDLVCQVDRRFLKNSLKVEWRRDETLVHLYEDGKSRPEKQHKDYHKRAHFLNKNITDGNFSLRLKNLRTEDEGVYTCNVYSDQECVCSVRKELKLRFTVKHTHHTPLHLGSSVVLPCYNDRPYSMEGLKVEWKRKEDLVHLYKDGASQAEEQHEDYQDRAHFFTEHLKDGNFSLRLDDLRAEDEGQYTCTVHFRRSIQNNRQFSTKTDLVLKLLEPVLRLQMFLVFSPNVLMFLAFVFWAVSEGSLFESVSCCSLYFLRPLTLLWTAPYDFPGKIKTWVQSYSFRTEYIVFSAVFYSVLFKSALDKSLNYSGSEGVVIIVLFVLVLLLNLFYIIFLFLRLFGKVSLRIRTIFNVLAVISFDVLPSLQFILLFFSFGSRGGFLIVAVLPVFLTASRYNWDVVCGQKMGCSPAVRRSVYLTLMILINALLIYFYITALENQNDVVGWSCMLVFLQFLWTLVNFTRSFSFDLPRVTVVYVFGSVGVVLLNSVALMTEVILKTVNGEGLTET
ncbi:uncharacterized protein LOC122329794 isoform X2 [Puntigrus tetrazona]|uniref:uncharacterized protein LOC122329794 isoform X2 n=1 Tax=Puntigrus tetrazona TaxID=1606681 RepID=UPI001C89C8B8|nr:uncharacterized protein LOC122329794 isoform X2 [Puntigrus tetrazona]XP_043082328.1 uncharacterized protein LOC122329794 isoform X2 [Puntigrus tetrazona]